MDIRLFDYDLPEGLIAQQPLKQRDGSRLLVIPEKGPFGDRVFNELAAVLPPESLIVLNDTRVIPARLSARKATGGQVEILLTRPKDKEGMAPDDGFDEIWQVICRPVRRLRPGMELEIEPPAGSSRARVRARAAVIELAEEGEAVMRFQGTGSPSLVAACSELGAVPLPPYIRRPDGPLPEDPGQYQTVYATRPGAVAAPTAGLHFTPQLLEQLEADGHETARLTLHVGPGTFLPVRTPRVEDHRMHSEWYRLPDGAAAAVNRAREQGRAVAAVGTTTMRVLESCVDPEGRVQPGEGETDLFIIPGFEFRAVDVLLTNFHLPRTTLLMLVTAFGGTDRVLAAYRHAVEQQYRFYSYGDAMLVFGAA